MLAQINFEAATGTGTRRIADHRRQVCEHLGILQSAISPATAAPTRISTNAAHRFPEFEFVEPELPPPSLVRGSGLLWLLFLAATVGLRGPWHDSRSSTGAAIDNLDREGLGSEVERGMDARSILYMQSTCTFN